MYARFIIDGADDAYANLALEEAIMAHNNEGLVVRAWRNEKSVIIGRSQLARYETNLDYCGARGVPVVRRLTAGGAVYNGPGNINWSLFVSREFSGGEIRYVWDVREVFRMCASLAISAIRRCGVNAWFDGPNRIVTPEGKVSGMAAYISRTGLLCHGTLLLDADLHEVQRLTEPADIALERRYTRSNPARVANTGIEVASFMNSLAAVIAQEIGAEPEMSRPRNDEMESMRVLLVQRYAEPEWNLGDPFTAGVRR